MSNIIITGANQGIGYYLTLALLEKGNDVAILDLMVDNFKAMKEKFGDRILTIICDVRNRDAVNAGVKKAMETFKTLDIVIHNACQCTFEPAIETDEAIYKDVWDVNFLGALRLCKAVIPVMKKQGSGKVILTSSGVGVMGFTNISPYASSKGAIESLAKCLKIEHKRDNITIHLFHPPLTATESSAPLPIPKEFMANPEIVGRGLAKNINKKGFIICHSVPQKMQTLMCYLFPLALGQMMSKLTGEYAQKTLE